MPIFLVRHGETVWNAARVVQLPGTPLSRRGREQARRVADQLADQSIAAIVSSDYARARATAAAVQAKTGARIEILPSLRERDFGMHRGTRFDELPADMFAPDYHPTGGESWDMFHARVDRAWEEVTAFATTVEGNTAVVSHGLVCRALVKRHLQVPEALAAEPVKWRNTALTIIEDEAPWRVTRLACTEHLDD